jgi:hypothetical protein
MRLRRAHFQKVLLVKMALAWHLRSWLSGRFVPFTDEWLISLTYLYKMIHVLYLLALWQSRILVHAKQRAPSDQLSINSGHWDSTDFSLAVLLLVLSQLIARGIRNIWCDFKRTRLVSLDLDSSRFHSGCLL